MYEQFKAVSIQDTTSATAPLQDWLLITGLKDLIAHLELEFEYY